MSTDFSFLNRTLSPFEMDSEIRVYGYPDDPDRVARKHRNGVIFLVQELVRVGDYEWVSENESCEIGDRCEGRKNQNRI